ncbi:MAG: formylglycine-generating enzyme family protein [Myxococcota bacterium]
MADSGQKSWQVTETCPCSNGACTGPTDADCTPGDSRCSPDGSQILVCQRTSGGAPAWALATQCVGDSCEDGQCVGDGRHHAYPLGEVVSSDRVTVERHTSDVPEVFAADSGSVRVLTPRTALESEESVDISVTRQEIEPGNTDVRTDGNGGRVETVHSNAFVFEPAGQTFDDPIVVEVELEPSSHGLSAEALEEDRIVVVPLYYWRWGTTWSPTGNEPTGANGEWVRATLQSEEATEGQGLSTVRVEGGRVFVSLLVDHFSVYTLPRLDDSAVMETLDYGLILFETLPVTEDFSMQVPGGLFANSALDFLTMKSTSKRRKRYAQVLKELVWETSRRKNELVTSVPAEAINLAVWEILGCKGPALCKTFDDFGKWVGALDDAGSFYKDRMADSGQMTDAVADGFEDFSDWRGDLDEQMEDIVGFAEYEAISKCLMNSLATTALYIWSDQAETQQRWAAIEDRLRASDLFQRDPAFEAAVDEVDAFAADLRDDSLGSLLENATSIFADNVVGAPDGCTLETLDLVSKSLLDKLKLSGPAGALIGKSIDIVREYVKKNLAEATYNAEHLSALGTILTQGNLVDYDELVVKETDYTEFIEVPSSIAYYDDASRDRWYRLAMAMRAAELVAETAQKTLRLEDVGWVTQKFTWMSDHLCVDCVSAGYYRDLLADQYEDRHAQYAALHDAVYAAMNDAGPHGGPSPSEACEVLGCDDGPCEPDCAGKDCGGDGCGGSCGSCADGETCDGAAQCVEEGADPCGGVTSEGCCEGDTLRYCEDGQPESLDCDAGTCGWNAPASFYDCSTDGSAEPSGTHPKACEGGCTPDCADKECGGDGCGDTCGTCGGDESCVVGQCQVDEDCGDVTSEGVCDGDVLTYCAGGMLLQEDCAASGMSCGWSDVNEVWTCVESDPGGGCWPDCPEMVEVPGGPFLMGCNESVDADCESDEYPQHEVDVPSFEIDVTEVTNASYAEFLNAHGNVCDGEECVDSDDSDLRLEQSGSVWTASAGYGDHPVVEVTWYGASGYCQWSGKRLCTESEWEKAARGTDGRKYPWGNAEATCEYAVMDDEFVGADGCGTDETWPVGSKPAGASPYGVLDMAGNVWEWVADRYHSDYEGAPTDGSAWEAGSSSYRPVRGGGFVNYHTYDVRAGHRYIALPDDSGAYSGFVAGCRCCSSTE